MACDITKNRDKLCKDTWGGVELIYLFTYIKHPRSKIKRSGLFLISYPPTYVYSIHIVSGNYSENTEIEGGVAFINQKMTASITHLKADNELSKLLKKDQCLILKDRNGKFRLMGAYNGVEADYSATTGSGHADFNGYTINFNSKEEEEALFFDSLEDVGFNLAGKNNSYIFQNGDNFSFQNNNNIIFN